MFVVYDLETTGLSTTSDDIVQFSYIRFDNNNMPVQAENLYFYYEGMHWSKEAEEVHGITLDFVKQHAEKFEENVLKMYSILSLSNVVGFNSDNFDNVFVRNWLARMGMSDTQLGIQKDIMLLARPVVHKPRISLVKLCDKLGITPDIIRSFEKLCYKNEGSQAHNGSYDVSATALVALQFMREGYLTWKFGKTDIKPDDVFGNDLANEDFMNTPEDPDGFWIYDGHHYNWMTKANKTYEQKAAVNDKPEGIVLYPKEVFYDFNNDYEFDWCSMHHDSEGKLHVVFEHGDYLAENMPFSSLLKQLKEESDKRCSET